MKQIMGRWVVLSCGLFFLHCAKSWGNFWESEFKSFSINGESGTIVTGSISVSLRWSGLTKLVAKFETTGGTVKVDGVEQVSGVTQNDFTQPKIYQIVAASGAARSYTVSVSVTFPIADTGQLSCYDASIAQPCPFAGFPRQDAEFVPAARSFSGPTAHATYTNDFTTKDNVTSLVWKTCSEGLSGSTCAIGTATTMTWNVANDGTTCVNLNSANSGAGYAGYMSWRMPTAEELRTLTNSSVATPSIDVVAFPGTVATSYWTANAYAPNTANAWSLGMGAGALTSNVKSSVFNVRCVAASPSTYAPALSDLGDGTIKDATNGLLWSKCSMDTAGTGTLQTYTTNCTNLSAGTRTWQLALQDCNNLTLAGKSWRLPSFAELASITDLYSASQGISATYFPGTALGQYHASTTSPFNFTTATRVNFADGGLGAIGKATAQAVRCVSGP